MTLTGNILVGLGGLLGVIGVLMIWIPVFGLLFLFFGFGLFVTGQFLRRKGRHHTVLRKQGGRGLF